MRFYLDTFVFSAYYDERMPERMKMTRDFWPILQEHEKLCSELTLQELSQAHSNLKKKLLVLTQNFTVLNVTGKMRKLAEHYIKELVSWNFKHMVRRSTRLLVNYINVERGLRTIEILAPPEV